jgi:hypothetical protein
VKRQSDVSRPKREPKSTPPPGKGARTRKALGFTSDDPGSRSGSFGCRRAGAEGEQLRRPHMSRQLRGAVGGDVETPQARQEQVDGRTTVTPF